MDAFSKAATNRSIRTIKTELDFLLDSSLLTPTQVSQIHALLPTAPSASSANRSQAASPVPHLNNLSISSPPPSHASNGFPHSNNSNNINHSNNFPSTPFHEKSQPLPSPTPSPAPPAYGASPGVASASALYAYNPTDAGDLALMPQDRVVILEYMNADWAKGRSERTGQEGIFPRSYVRVEEEKGMPPPPQWNGAGNGQSSGYGNMPLEVAQGGPGQQGQMQNGQQGGGPDSKVNTQGKKFGKKLGNAAIFGAGASIGSNIVNGIF